MTDIDKVRLLTGDRAPATPVFSDADVLAFLETEESVKKAAAALLEAWAALYVANPTSEGIGNYSYSHQTVENLLSLAKRLRDADADAPAADYAEMDLLEGIRVFRNLLLNRCTVQRYVPGAADAYGAPAKAWVDFLIDQPCRLSSPRGRQVLRSTEVVPVDAVLFIEEVDVTEADRVVVDHISWEILFVAPLQDGVSGHHLELGLKRVKP